jgi:bifunctional non-homologous end joining protein LigD
VAKAERLADYRRKRDQKQTPEPAVKPPGRKSEPVEGARGSRKVIAARGARKTKERVFVVQRHDATRLHYDFRLEIGGALASWAVPKGVPLEPGQQHLAVHVEDHPLEYATFEGEIPKGNYGAGTVEIWDTGTYELLERKKNGGLTVRLHGQKLEGVWALVPAKLSGDEKNWLLIRKRDESEPPKLSGGRYAPMLATLERSIPRGGDWLHEVKWDGYRALAYVRGGEVELVSRNGNSLTERFSAVAKELAKAARTPNCVLDGEVCAIGEDGRATFSAMQQGKPGTRYIYVAFDLLEVEGEPLLDTPLESRRHRLEQLLDKRNKTVQFSAAFDDGDALYAAASERGFEGVLSKRRRSTYQPGRRSRDWVKVKTHGSEEFVIGGYTRGEGRRSNSFGSLLLGVYDEGIDKLRYVGSVGTGFNEREIEKLLALMRPLETSTPPFDPVPKPPRVRKGDIAWVEPRLVAEVEFVEWTHDGRLRAPSYQGLREDKGAYEVRGEDAPLPTTIKKGSRELKLSNLDKVFFPDDGVTKGDLLRYYRAVAPVLVPHLKDRPFTMIRYPDGIKGKFFFQKDAPSHLPEWIETYRALVSTRESPRRKKWVNFALVNDELALLWMVNMGCVDMNAWYSRVDKPERPDFVLFDLDPSPDVGFEETVQVALLVKQALAAFGLVGYPKTSSADGMHVIVPIERRYTFDDTRRFSEIVAGAIARTHRGLATTEWQKDRRRGVLIDANQNGEGKTIATAYSVRPRPGAVVSTPLGWDEVDENLDPRAFTMEVVLSRIAERGDLYAEVLTKKQRLNEALNALK